jgi:hypothetical protein
LAKEEHRKSRDIPATERARASHDNDDLYQEPGPSTNAQPTPAHDSADPTSPTSQGSPKGLKSLLTKLKRRSKHAPANEVDDDTKEKETGFVGGASLRDSTIQPESSKSPIQPNRVSMDSHVSAEAEKSLELNHPQPVYVPHVDYINNDHYSEVSSLSDAGEEFSMPRGRRTERVASGGTATSGGESFEEARDHFDETLAPPPAFGSDVDDAKKGSSNRESKFQEVGL